MTTSPPQIGPGGRQPSLPQFDMDVNEILKVRMVCFLLFSFFGCCFYKESIILHYLSCVPLFILLFYLQIQPTFKLIEYCVRQAMVFM